MSRLFEILRVSLGALRSHGMRSALTLLGIVIGVATIILVVGAISGLNAFVEEKVFSLSPDVFIVSKFGIITSRDGFLKALRRKNLTVSEMDQIRSLCTTCRGVGGSLQGRKSMRFESRRSPDVQVTGSTANLAELFKLDLAAGRFYTDAEVRRASPVIVIGWKVREVLFPGSDPLGRVLSIDGYPLKIVGVLREQGSVLGQDQDNVAWIPLKLYEKVFGRNRSVDIWVRAASLAAFDETQEEVRILLRRIRGTPFDGDDPFGLVNAAALQGLWRGISSAALAMMVLIAGISLVVGGIVIMNIMLVSVVERTQEIGVRTAVGARRRDVLMQFLLEAAVLASVGGVIGAIIGIAGTQLVTALTSFPTRVSPSLVGMAMLMATSTGLVFGIWPAWRASRLDPIDALRSE
jgi:putative ABC transport system permease protein